MVYRIPKLGKYLSKLEMDLKLTKAALATTQAALDSQLTKRATYRRYFDYSNDLEINEQIATQGKVARSVWETGGSAG